MIQPPTPPVEPEYEDVDAQSDLAHAWRLDEDGEIDRWVKDAGFHNGPGCSRCYYSFCLHCEEDGYLDMSCAREQAKMRNSGRFFSYKAAVQAYEAQMEYYRTLVE